jgi:HK97 family phage prohead protease
MSEGLTEDERPAEEDANVTVQPSISTEEAAETDVELSPVGDEKVEVGTAPEEEAAPETTVVDTDADIQVRSAQKREIDVRIMPWDLAIPSNGGLESFARGAFADTNPGKVVLVGVEHERRWALGHNGEPTLTRHPVGKGLSIEERDDGAYMTFKVANTPGGDEVLALVQDGITQGVSVEFDPLPGGTQVRSHQSGRRHSVRTRVRLNAVSPTYRPAYGEQAAVLAVRSQQEEATMAEEQTAPVDGAAPNIAELIEFARSESAKTQTVLDKMLERLDRVDERTRSQSIDFPGATSHVPALTMGEWTSIALKSLAGDRLSVEELGKFEQVRTLDDVITSDNTGVVPPTYLSEIRGVIDTSRPFLASTRRLETPAAGTQINVPIITQRPTTAVQSAEKAEVDSTKTLIGTNAFNMVTIAGAGDLSIQIIKRSSPSFLALWLELLAEAYAIDAEDQALRALFNATGGGITAADPLNPANLSLGAAYQTSFNAIRRPPDTLWLSTEAIGEFIDAKATTTNQPLYPGLTASATAAGGISGTVSGLRVVHVPALDAHGSFGIVGPSSGFAWAEDGAYELQADVPSKAGRDVALVSMMWYVPWYPAAFTLYNVAS